MPHGHAAGADGNEIGAGRGLLHTLTSLLRQEDVTHVAIAFDTVVDAPMDRGPDGPWKQHVLAADICPRPGSCGVANGATL